MVVEKPTGEFGVNLDAIGPVLLLFAEFLVIVFPVSSFNTLPAELQARSTVSDLFSNLAVGIEKLEV